VLMKGLAYTPLFPTEKCEEKHEEIDDAVSS
jgi:hypothetical protein